MTTAIQAVENAARILTTQENSLRKTYGNLRNEYIPLATAWTNLAEVILLLEQGTGNQSK